MKTEGLRIITGCAIAVAAQVEEYLNCNENAEVLGTAISVRDVPDEDEPEDTGEPAGDETQETGEPAGDETQETGEPAGDESADPKPAKPSRRKTKQDSPEGEPPPAANPADEGAQVMGRLTAIKTKPEIIVAVTVARVWR